ncbi:MAG: FAD-dependent oxidoreductase [Chloroflexi bacterium]|nr:FAD-dependent oxidoreductase [Chloroflexota bacterium]
MPTKIVVLGAGFGGLELSGRLSDTFGTDADITLIDRNEGFVFGFHKFELMLGRATLEDVRLDYRDIMKPGVRFRREVIASIDPVSRRVVTDGGTYDADILVIGLGAEYDFAATPGFVQGGSEFYSVDGALRLRDVLPQFKGGQVVIAILGEPFKCPPAPCEAAILLDEYFTQRSLANFQISVVSPWGRPIPPSPDGSKTILARFAERGISFVKEQMVVGIDPSTRTARLRDGGTLPYDLFLGIPRHRVPDVVAASGLAEGGWIPVERGTLRTRFPNVFAVGDVTSVGTPKAGVFAENAAAVVAQEIIAQMRGSEAPRPYGGTGTCYVELGEGRVARLDADFFGGPTPVAPLTGPNPSTAQEKRDFSAVRRARWFGGEPR